MTHLFGTYSRSLGWPQRGPAGKEPTRHAPPFFPQHQAQRLLPAITFGRNRELLQLVEGVKIYVAHDGQYGYSAQDEILTHLADGRAVRVDPNAGLYMDSVGNLVIACF